MSETAYVLPDYDRSILSLSSSILAHFGAKADHKTLPTLDAALGRKYQTVILVILDGLGTDLLNRTLSPSSFLRRHFKETISSVFPPTTTAATITLYSGQPPISHGWLGWACYFPEHGRVIELFTDKDYYTQEKVPDANAADILAYEHIFEKIKNASGEKIETHEVFPGSIRAGGPETFPNFCDRIKGFSKGPGRRFILGYWPQPDGSSHEHGPHSETVKKTVKDIDAHLEELSKNLEDAILIVTADHGHTATKETVVVNDYPDFLACLARPLSFGQRSSSVFVKEGMKNRFEALFNQYFAKDFALFEKSRILETDLFGPGKAHPKTVDFIGDYVIASISSKSLRQHVPGYPPRPDYKGNHSGLTRQEMEVPLIIVEKRKR